MLLESRQNISDYKVIDSGEIRVYDASADPAQINRMRVEQDIAVSALFESGVSLEDYFKQLVGEVRS